MRLIIAVPITLMAFTLGSGFLTFSLIRKGPLGAMTSNIYVGIWILIMGGVAFLTGLVMAYGITNPLRKMVKKGEEILSSPKASSHYNEISVLTDVFERITFSLDQFLQDHQILENLREGIITLDVSGAIISSNKVAERFFGSELRGRPYWEVLPSCPENQSFIQRVRKALRGEGFLLSQEERLKNRNNEEFTLWVSISHLNEPKGIIISLKDLLELKQTRDQIRYTERLAEIGAFSSSLSHEIKNPLGSMRGLLELLQKDLPPEDRKRDYVDRAIQEVDRLSNLTENLLGLLYVERLKWEPGVNVNEVLSQTLSLARHDFFAKNLIIEEKYGEDLPPIEADSEKLGQAFLNLILNAFQQTPEGGYFSLSTTLLPSAISIQFHNSGSYIPPEEKERLFTAFFTTKPHGTGLGLFLARRIVALHQGKIEVESNLEKGTTFRIELPLMIS